MLAFKRVKKERIYSWSKTKLRLWDESSDWVLSRKTVRGWHRRTGNTGALAVSVQQIKVTEKEEKAGLLQEDSSSARWAVKNNSASSDCVNSDASKPHPCATSYKTQTKTCKLFPSLPESCLWKKNLTATSVTRNNAKAVHTYGTQLMILLNETDQLLEQ